MFFTSGLIGMRVYCVQIQPREAKSANEEKNLFDRVSDKIEKMQADRISPKNDVTRDNDGKIVGAHEAHDANLRSDPPKK
jgi:hypothetical protein